MNVIFTAVEMIPGTTAADAIKALNEGLILKSGRRSASSAQSFGDDKNGHGVVVFETEDQVSMASRSAATLHRRQGNYELGFSATCKSLIVGWESATDGGEHQGRLLWTLRRPRSVPARRSCGGRLYETLRDWHSPRLSPESL